MKLPINSNILLSDREYGLFAKYIYEKSGIDLGDNKKELLKARLMKRIRHLGLNSYREYYEYVIGDITGNEFIEMIDAVSTNVTQFFREKQHFDFMTRIALPRIIEKKRQEGTNRIRIWSCAASTGEEVYTILITLLEYLHSTTSWDVKILGTDISSKVLAIAKEARYSFDRIKTIPLLLQDKYFDIEYYGREKIFQVKEPLRNMVVLRRLNLMDETFPFHGKFDIIFCRNVMIYFDKPTQEKVVNKLHRYLDDSGYLFIGHSESLLGLKVGFKTVAPAAFTKL